MERRNEQEQAETPATPSGRRRAASLLISILASTLVAVAIARLYVPRANVAWDESQYLMSAYSIYGAARSGSISTLWRATEEQFGYPPLPSWLFGIPFVPVGFSIEGARVLNLFWFILGNVMLAALATVLGGTAAGVLSSLLYLSSPFMLLYGAVAMREAIGAAFTLLAVSLYCRARINGRVAGYLLTSLALFALTMVKYNYGVLVAGAIAVEAIVHLVGGRERKRILLAYAYLYIPFVLALESWIFLPTDRLPAFLAVLSNPWTVTSGMTDWSQRLLFYPRAIALMYSPSIITGILLLSSLIAAPKYFADFRVRFLWLCVALNLLLGLIHSGNMQERFIFTVVPLLFALAAYVLMRWVRVLRSWSTTHMRRAVLVALALVLGTKLLVDMLRLPDYVYAVGAYSMKSPMFNQVDFRDTWFNYDVETWPRQLPPPDAEAPRTVVDYVANSIDLSKPVYIAGYANELPPDYFNLVFALHREHGEIQPAPYSSYVVTLQVLPTSRYYTRDYRMFNERNQWTVTRIAAEPSLAVLRERSFAQLGVVVRIYAPSDEVNM
ncbi:MAG: ArnT family glycosyltransferase [Candidatus Binatia bacterium]